MTRRLPPLNWLRSFETAGRLVAPFDIELAGENAYWITVPSALVKRPHIVAFRNWLLEEAAASS